MLLLLDEHLGTDEIAKRLFISEHTVRSHVKSLLRKLGVSSRREALEHLAVARAAVAESPTVGDAVHPGQGTSAPATRPISRIGKKLLFQGLAMTTAATRPHAGLFAFSPEPFERGLDEARQRLEVVAALEHGRDARREGRGARAPARESRRPSRRISASGSSSCASKPAETSTSSGSNSRDRRARRARSNARDVLVVARSPRASGMFTVVSAWSSGPPVPG